MYAGTHTDILYAKRGRVRVYLWHKLCLAGGQMDRGRCQNPAHDQPTPPPRPSFWPQGQPQWNQKFLQIENWVSGPRPSETTSHHQPPTHPWKGKTNTKTNAWGGWGALNLWQLPFYENILACVCGSRVHWKNNNNKMNGLWRFRVACCFLKYIKLRFWFT